MMVKVSVLLNIGCSYSCVFNSSNTSLCGFFRGLFAVILVFSSALSVPLYTIINLGL